MNVIQTVKFISFVFSSWLPIVLYIILVMFLLLYSTNTFVMAQVELSKTQAQWVQRGKPLVEYPLCYQLWQCHSQTSPSPKNTSTPLRPIGTWGLCENYLSQETGKTLQCARCDATIPEFACF